MSSYIYTTTTDNNFTFAELEANIVHLPDDNTGNYVLVKTVDDEYSWKNVQEFSGDISNIPSQVICHKMMSKKYERENLSAK